MYQIKYYTSSNGKNYIQNYLNNIRDLKAYSRILLRIERIQKGNFGDHKRLTEDIWELRIDVGKGYRVYYTLYENQVVLLLCAGTKSSQSKDIEKAHLYKQDFNSQLLLGENHV